MSLQARYESAPRFSEFLAGAKHSAALWRDTYRLTKVPDDAVARAAAVPGRWHLLALLEDWCIDAVNPIPVLARLTELVPTFDLRILARDDNPDLMDAHLTNGTRSIPVVLVLDANFVERGWWGPRPSPLQAWMLGEGQQLEKEERYRHARAWHARDRGRTTLDEVLTLVERAAAAPGDAGPEPRRGVGVAAP